MLENKDFCDYDTYVALEELGYPEVMAFNKPFLLYEAQKWLREEKGIHIEIDRIGCSTGYSWQVSIVKMEYNLCKSVINNNNSYEEALSEGIKEAIKILKEE